ncbi:MAG: hypothetical protein KKH92_02670 [Firmicutes bacterium]|nr:hypothetical protein [Bacillota bacterium]
MNHSNRGLNEPFYKWIDDVRRAMRKEKELQEKLEFYNMKLIGYKGVSYDRIGSSGSRSSGDSELLFWLDKISTLEQKITANQIIISEKTRFLNDLNNDEKLVFIKNMLNTEGSDLLPMSIKIKTIRLSIIRKWFSLFYNITQ